MASNAKFHVLGGGAPLELAHPHPKPRALFIHEHPMLSMIRDIVAYIHTSCLTNQNTEIVCKSEFSFFEETIY